MKSGMTLVELAEEIQRQQATKRDFIAPSKELVMEPLNCQLRINGHGCFPMTTIAEEQIASRIGIPQKYYDRMKVSSYKLLAENVNHWFGEDNDKRLIRTLDGTARAFLSDRYRPLDHMDMAEAVMPLIAKPGFTVESAELTQKRLYIKVVTSRITAEIGVGDVVQAGIVISNSEVGMGSVKVEPLVYRLVCRNGAIINDLAMRQAHIGRSTGNGDIAEQFFRDDTRQADDKAFWMKIRDVVEGTFSEVVFGRIVKKMKDAAARIIDAEVVKVVEVVKREHALTADVGGGVLNYLIKGGDFSQYGLGNAITRVSQDVHDYDQATELERLGGDVCSQDGGWWKGLMDAARDNRN